MDATRRGGTPPSRRSSRPRPSPGWGALGAGRGWTRGKSTAKLPAGRRPLARYPGYVPRPCPGGSLGSLASLEPGGEVLEVGVDVSVDAGGEVPLGDLGDRGVIRVADVGER